jgi:hypothetical protein
MIPARMQAKEEKRAPGVKLGSRGPVALAPSVALALSVAPLSVALAAKVRVAARLGVVVR